MEFTRYLRLILKRYWIVLIFELLAISSTYYYTINRQPSYTAEALLFLNPKVTNSGVVPYSAGDFNYLSTQAINYDYAIKTQDFAQKVAQQLNLPVGQVIGTYTSRLVPGSYVFNIDAISTDPVKAQKIANAVTSVFLSTGVSSNGVITGTQNDAIKGAVESLRQQLTEIQVEINGLRSQVNQLVAATPSAKNTDDLGVARRQLTEAVDFQSRIVTSISQAESNNLPQNNQASSLISEAPLPGHSDDNGLLRNLIFAVAIGLALGVGVIILLDFLDYTIRSSEDLATLTGATTLGVIPIVRPTKPRESSNATDSITAAADGASQPVSEMGIENASPLLVTANEFKSGASESYRALRTNVLFSTLTHTRASADSFLNSIELAGTGSGLNSTTKTLLVTSSLPREGKSMTTANLAVTFAQAGNRVIVVDTDLRQPTLHKMFGLTNDVGFSNLLLAGADHLSTFIKKTGLPNLAVITAGNPPPNPSELLTSNRATEVIRLLRDAADIVIFDSPPVVLVSDAAILATRVDGVLLVARSGRTRRDTITKAVTKLRNVNGNVVGTVLNYVQGKDDGGYYYYGSYGYGYGNPKSSSARRKAAKTVNPETTTKV